MNSKKNRPQKLLIIGPNLFFHSPAQPTAHSPELIFHIIKMSQDTSVSLSVLYGFTKSKFVISRSATQLTQVHMLNMLVLWLAVE